MRETVDAYDAAGAPQSRSRLQMAGAHAAYDEGGWELIAEFYGLRNQDLSGASGRHANRLGYVHAGRALDDRWQPYYRFENASLDAGDPYFLALRNGRPYSRHVLGMRYNADPRAALKLEFNRTRDADVARVLDEWRLQYAVGF